MSDQHGPEHYEETDMEARPIQIAAAGIAVFLALALTLSAITVKLVTRHRVETDEPAVFASKRLPPPPRLQVDEVGDLAAYRHHEAALLNNYGWIDATRGVVRLPIDRAIDLTAAELYRGSK